MRGFVSDWRTRCGGGDEQRAEDAPGVLIPGPSRPIGESWDALALAFTLFELRLDIRWTAGAQQRGQSFGKLSTTGAFYNACRNIVKKLPESRFESSNICRPSMLNRSEGLYWTKRTRLQSQGEP